jgi:hypothetical protein
MDFMDRLCDRINEIPSLPVRCERGYLGDDESLVIYPLPGSRIVQGYMDGTSDQQLNYEIAMKSKIPGSIHSTLWAIQTDLEKIKELESNNDSFKFEELIITNKPFINNADDQGWFVFLLNVQANITVLKEE